MHRFFLPLLLVLTFGCATHTASDFTMVSASHGPQSSSCNPDWGYSTTNGPAQWCTLDNAEWASCCVGTSQSPVNIVTSATQSSNLWPKFTFASFTPVVTNTSRTIQVSAANNANMGAVLFDGTIYPLTQFHVHLPSEHQINGANSPMEVHLVYQNSKLGKTLVVGVMVNQSSAGIPAPPGALGIVIQNTPSAACQSKTVSGTTMSAADVMPPQAGSSYYKYAGSLTTPGCGGGVTWLVAQTPITISGPTLAAFQRVYANNTRPVQSLGTRTVYTLSGGGQ